jgi:hypothetical protein
MAKTAQIGAVYGAWKVLEARRNRRYRCLCTACGKTVKNVRVYDLLNGSSRMCKSCAASKDVNTAPKPLEYNSWNQMIQRCYSPGNKDYKNYGARGISVYPLWRDSFEAFYMSLGPRPDPSYTIERIDTNGNYEPGNVKWASRAEQTRNQRSNINVTIDGETKTVAEWSEDPRCPVDKFCIYKRIKRGWDPERAILEKSHGKKE